MCIRRYDHIPHSHCILKSIHKQEQHKPAQVGEFLFCEMIIVIFPLVHYRDSSQYSQIAQELDLLLQSYGTWDHGSFLLQDKVDSFIQDTRHYDISHLPTLLDNVEFEVDFPGPHDDCDSGQEEENLDDTMPYISPSDLYDQQQEQLGAAALDNLVSQIQVHKQFLFHNMMVQIIMMTTTMMKSIIIHHLVSLGTGLISIYIHVMIKPAHWDHIGEHLTTPQNQTAHVVQVHQSQANNQIEVKL